jgi:hypothetical protein
MRHSKFSMHWNIRGQQLMRLTATCLEMVARAMAVHIIASVNERSQQESTTFWSSNSQIHLQTENVNARWDLSGLINLSQD